MIRCPACNTENKPSTRFCRECGGPLPAAPAPQPDEAEDNDKTVLIPPTSAATGGERTNTIELAVKRMAPASEPSAAPDDDMTIVLPKKKSPPTPKYEPAPPTITGPLTEPPKRPKHTKPADAPRAAPTADTAKRSMTPVVVLVLLAITGGSAGYLGWLMLQKNKNGTTPDPIVAQSAPVQPPAPPVPAGTPPAEPAAQMPSAPSTAVEPVASAPTPQAPDPNAAVPTKASGDAIGVERPDQRKAARADAAKKEKLAKQQKAAPTPASAAAADAAAAPPPRPVESPRPAPQLAEAPARVEASPLALLREELGACEAQNFFKREFCKHQARQRHCAGMWDRVPECPAKKEDKLY